VKSLEVTRHSRLMVLAPHPDDETLAAGGLLQQALAAGAAVRVLFLTAGDNNPWGQRVLERRWRIGPADRRRYAWQRRSEAEGAMAALGVRVEDGIWLGYEDQGLTRLLLAGDMRIVNNLAGRINEWRPTLLVTPSLLDLHPDHSAAGLAARLALDGLAVDGCPADRLEYLIHTRGSQCPRDRILTLTLSDRQRVCKRQAVLCHASQVKVRRRSLLARAGDREAFLIPQDAPTEICEGHAVRRARIDGGWLCMQLVLRARPRAFGRVTLVLLAYQTDPSGAVYQFVLPRSGWRVRRKLGAVGFVRTAGAEAGPRVQYRGGRRGGEVRVPLEALQPPARLFAKVQRRFGLFDEAGWREIPLDRSVYGD
jgi:LmbE family N-acetylglucosaminyl deacetylase